jgi:hypothetical protein
MRGFYYVVCKHRLLGRQLTLLNQSTLLTRPVAGAQPLVVRWHVCPFPRHVDAVVVPVNTLSVRRENVLPCLTGLPPLQTFLPHSTSVRSNSNGSHKPPQL